MIKKKEREDFLRRVAIAAVILHTSEGEFLTPSPYRAKGKEWSIDHRRTLIGRRNLFRSKSKRSTSR
ncbi:hypothetical protein OAH71_02115 [Euryarchaeota archaeon]|jgi:hypothetical protein|nr:hypothetical protein [Euryarchaeota archaeon]|tara:strand:- start:1674 stop:1874 length:201 start_codon:yes stop_codon:yes gene_type:complete